MNTEALKMVTRVKIFNGGPDSCEDIADRVNIWIEENIDKTKWEIINFTQAEAVGGTSSRLGASMSIYIWYKKPIDED